MFRKLSISKTVDAMVTEKVGVVRAKVPGYSKSKWPSNKYEKRCAGSRQFIHLMLQDTKCYNERAATRRSLYELNADKNHRNIFGYCPQQTSWQGI